MDSEKFPIGNTDSLSALAEFVRERRHARGWSQQELADYAGVGRRFVIDLEAGKPTVRLDAVRRVVRLFGKDIGVVDGGR